MQYAYGKKAICILHKNFPQRPSPWAFRFKHTLAALATVVLPPAVAEAAADGEAMVVDMMVETEAVS
jgi:hypothetical protein